MILSAIALSASLCAAGSPGSAPPEDGAAWIDAALREHVRALSELARRTAEAGPDGLDLEAEYIEGAFRLAGLAEPGEALPFMKGFRHEISFARLEADPSAEEPALVSLRRHSGDQGFRARPLPFSPADGPGPFEVGFTDEVVFLDPEDLAGLAGTAQQARFTQGILLTLERPGLQEPGPLLAAQARAARMLGAAALILIRSGDFASAYQDLASDLSHAARLPAGWPPPSLLVLISGPDLGVELFGRQAFSRLARAPMEAVEAAYRPILLDVRMSVKAAITRTQRSGRSLVGLLPGADASLAAEAVLVCARRDEPAEVAALIEVARQVAPAAGRPRRSILFGAFDGQGWGLAGSSALAARAPEGTLELVETVSLEALIDPAQMERSARAALDRVRRAAD